MFIGDAQQHVAGRAPGRAWLGRAVHTGGAPGASAPSSSGGLVTESERALAGTRRVSPSKGWESPDERGKVKREGRCRRSSSGAEEAAGRAGTALCGRFFPDHQRRVTGCEWPRPQHYSCKAVHSCVVGCDCEFIRSPMPTSVQTPEYPDNCGPSQPSAGASAAEARSALMDRGRPAPMCPGCRLPARTGVGGSPAWELSKPQEKARL